MAGVQLGEEAVVLLVLLGIDARPDLLLLVGVGDDERPLALAQRGLDGVGEARARCPSFTTRRSTTSSMSCFSFLSRASRSGELVDHAVDAHAREAALRDVAEQVLVLALAVLDERREQRGCGSPRGDCRIASTICCARLLADRPAAAGAVLHADRGVEHAQVVVHLGDRARPSSAGCSRPPSARWRWSARGRGWCRTWASPSARGTGGRTTRATRRSGAAPRRRGCRRRATTCRTRRRR